MKVMSIRGMLVSLATVVSTLLIAAFAGLTWLSYNDNKINYDVSTEGLIIPSYEQQSIDFIPSYDPLTTLPFTASAIIDIDNDGIEELFLGGGRLQNDAIYRFINGSFTDITAETGWSKDFPDKTFSSVSLDLDNDDDNDLLLTRESGVWKYTNDEGVFTGKKLALELDSKTVPLALGVADLNRDGQYDLYVAGYIAREHVEGETIFNREYGGVSSLFINTGEDTFRDATEESGLYYKHNTFLGMFIDVDQDKQEDLMVAHDTGQIRTWKNRGNGEFTNEANPSSEIFAYPMGIAVTDYGNDGLPDFWFSNVGTTTPDFLVRGDLREDQVLHKDWFFLKNQGNFQFDDIAEQARLADYEFSWGAVFEDLNLDGRDDLLVSENYTGWPLHALKMWRLDSRYFLQTESGEFAETGKQAGVSNREYGITPLAADFNQDGYPDIVHVNLLGPQNVFLSQGGEQGHLKVKLPNTVASIGARVVVTLESGKQLNQFFTVGEGLGSDQSHILTFGLGDESVTKITVINLSGPDQRRQGPYRNETVRIQ